MINLFALSVVVGQSYYEQCLRTIPAWLKGWGMRDKWYIVISDTGEPFVNPPWYKHEPDAFDVGYDPRRPWCARVVTQEFHRHGAFLNKGAGLNDVLRNQLHSDGHIIKENFWILLFDCDILPPPNWRQAVEAANPIPGHIYGCHRRQPGCGHTAFIAGKPEPDIYPDGVPCGYFMLFHASDDAMKWTPAIPDQFYHAGSYDSELLERWPPGRQHMLPLIVDHLGEPGKNWFGPGNEARMAELKANRRMGKSWRNETVANVAALHPRPDATRPS